MVSGCICTKMYPKRLTSTSLTFRRRSTRSSCWKLEAEFYPEYPFPHDDILSFNVDGSGPGTAYFLQSPFTATVENGDLQESFCTLPAQPVTYRVVYDETDNAAFVLSESSTDEGLRVEIDLALDGDGVSETCYDSQTDGFTPTYITWRAGDEGQVVMEDAYNVTTGEYCHVLTDTSGECTVYNRRESFPVGQSGSHYYLVERRNFDAYQDNVIDDYVARFYVKNETNCLEDEPPFDGSDFQYEDEEAAIAVKSAVLKPRPHPLRAGPGAAKPVER